MKSKSGPGQGKQNQIFIWTPLPHGVKQEIWDLGVIGFWKGHINF